MLKSSVKVTLRQDARQLACRVNVTNNLARHLPMTVKVVRTVDLCLSTNSDQLQEDVPAISQDRVVSSSHQFGRCLRSIELTL